MIGFAIWKFRFCLNILVISIFLFAQPIIGRELKLKHERIGLSEGLSHSDALAIDKDALGFIWVGTLNGLNKYDGYGFESFFSKDSTRSAVQNRIYDLAVGKDNFIWLATQVGASRFNIVTEQFEPLTLKTGKAKLLSFNSELLRKVMIDSRNWAWFIANKKIFVVKSDNNDQHVLLDKDNILGFPKDDELDELTDFAEDIYGNIWISTGNGIIQIQVQDDKLRYAGTFFNLASNDKSLKNYIGDVFINKKGELVYFTATSMEFVSLKQNKFGATEISKVKHCPLLPMKLDDGNTFVFSYGFNILQDSKDNYWYISNNYVVKTKEVNGNLVNSIVYNSTNSSDECKTRILFVPDLFMDKSECLFIGSYGNGLITVDINQKPFHWISKNTTKYPFLNSGELIGSIYQDEEGLLWMCSMNRFGSFNTKNGKVESIYKAEDIGEDNHKYINCLNGKKDGNVWIGTNFGIEIYNKKSKTRKYIEVERKKGSSYYKKSVTAISFDIYGQAWVGKPEGGIIVIKEKPGGGFSQTKINNEKSNYLLSDKINQIYCDPTKPEIFVSSYMGFDRIFIDNTGNVVKIIHYKSNKRNPYSLSSDVVFPIAKYNDSTYMVGTLGGGLNEVVFLPGVDSFGFGNYRSKVYTTADGLLSNDVEGILIDNEKRVWFSGNALSVLNPKTNEIINYNKPQGIKVDAFKVNAYYKGSDNMLYFGGVNGITYFNPKEIKKNEIKTNIVITRLLVNNVEIHPNQSYKNNTILTKNISYCQNIKLSYLENDFVLEFASLHYASPKSNKFKYKLHGFDKDWKYTLPGNNQAQYTNLPYKDYEFEVYGSNNDGEWFKIPALLKIEITPPWWKSTLAYMLYFLLFLGLLAYIYISQSKINKVNNAIEIAKVEKNKNEELVNTKLQFFTNISHEFKTPLTLIYGPAEELIQNPEMESSRRFNAYELIKNNASRLLGLVNELIDFRKIETGNYKLVMSICKLDEFVHNVADNFVFLAEQKQIGFKIDIKPFSQPFELDLEKLEKIISNLLSNSIKYTNTGGHVLLKVEQSPIYSMQKFTNSIKISTQEQAHNNFISITITDTGIGISEESLKHIFDRFFQIDEIGKNRHLGSGIGLALVKSLVIAHKGEISVSSERMEGTEFIVRIPIGRTFYEQFDDIIWRDKQVEYQRSNIVADMLKLEMSEPQLIKKHINLNPVDTILIVEDNISIQSYIAETLSQTFKIVTANDGNEALNVLNNQRIDLLLSDVMMPNMDGLELCRIVKSDSNLCHIPLILLTAKDTMEDKIEAVKLGADLYVEKPFSMVFLLTSIQNTLNYRREIQQKFCGDIYAENSMVANNLIDKKFLDDVIAIVDKRMHEIDFKLDELCKEVGMSRTVFYHKLKSLTNQTPIDFLRTLRLKNAAQLLSNTNETVDDILIKVGIQSRSNFTKVFKAQFGKLPSDFRK